MKYLTNIRILCFKLNVSAIHSNSKWVATFLNPLQSQKYPVYNLPERFFSLSILVTITSSHLPPSCFFFLYLPFKCCSPAFLLFLLWIIALKVVCSHWHPYVPKSLLSFQQAICQIATCHWISPHGYPASILNSTEPKLGALLPALSTHSMHYRCYLPNTITIWPRLTHEYPLLTFWLPPQLPHLVAQFLNFTFLIFLGASSFWN